MFRKNSPAATSSVRFARTFGVSVGLLTTASGSASADAVTDWNTRAGNAAVAACIAPADDPLHESRMYAMMHVAIHDALNAIDRRSRPYAYDATVSQPFAKRLADARGHCMPTRGWPHDGLRPGIHRPRYFAEHSRYWLCPPLHTLRS
jgi:hypothetical protein